MTRDEFGDITQQAGDLSVMFRDVAAAGRAAWKDVVDGARASRDAMQATGVTVRTLAGTFSSALGGAFRRAMQDGAKLSEILRGLALDVASSVGSRALSGLSNQLGAALGKAVGSILPFAKGGVVDAGAVRRFAQGGVVPGPTLFPLRDGSGLMGEAGPEAILPLRRGADGKLGVAAAGGGTVVNVTINTPDAASFQRSRTQVAAALARAVDRGRRNL